MGIKSYHSSAFPGRVGPALTIPARQPLVGVEFETEISNRDTLIDMVEAAFLNKEVKFHPESDSSLTSSNGVEFVSSPAPASLFASSKGPLASLLNIIGKHETHLRTYGIGMHVNVSARSAEHAHATAICGNLLATISRRVGGRGDVYSSHYGGVYDKPTHYGKQYAVAVRNRAVSGTPWTCPRTGVVLPPWSVTNEWRNEFRNHRSTTDFLRARIQIRYSVLVSEFATANMEKLLAAPRDNIKPFVSELERQFVTFVKLRARGNGTTTQLLALINDRSRCIWHFGKADGDSPEERAKAHRCDLGSGVVLA